LNIEQETLNMWISLRLKSLTTQELDMSSITQRQTNPLEKAMEAYQFGRATQEQNILLIEHVSSCYDPDSEDCQGGCRYSESCAKISQLYDLRKSVV